MRAVGVFMFVGETKKGHHIAARLNFSLGNCKGGVPPNKLGYFWLTSII